MATYSHVPSYYERSQPPQGLSSRCEHMASGYCLGPSPQCCSCNDLTAPSDGTASSHSDSERWSNYCAPCQVFWKRQPEEAKIAAKPAATEHPQQDFTRLNAPFNTVPFIPKTPSRVMPPPPATISFRPVIVTSNPLIVPSPPPALRVLPPPQYSPLRKKKRAPSGNNKKPDQNTADAGKYSDQLEEGPSNSQNENTPGADPPVVTVPTYVCPAARAGARKAYRGTGAAPAPVQAEEPTRRWSLTSLHSAPGSSEGSASSPQKQVSFNIAGENNRGNSHFYRPRATGIPYQAPRSSGGFYQAYRPPTQPLRSSGSYVPPPARNSAESRNLLSEWRPARPGDLDNPRAENNTTVTSTRDSAQGARYQSRTWEGAPVPDPPDGSWSSDWQPPTWTERETVGAPAEQSPVSWNSLFPRSRPPPRGQSPQAQSQGPIRFGDSIANSPVTEGGPSNDGQPSTNATPGWLEWSQGLVQIANSPVARSDPSNAGQPATNTTPGWRAWTDALFNGPQSHDPQTTRDSPVNEISWDAPSTQPLSSGPESQRHTIHDSESGGASQGLLSMRRNHFQGVHDQTQIQRTNSTTPVQNQHHLPQYHRSVGIPAAPVILPISSPQPQRVVALPTIPNPNFNESESDEDNVWSNMAPLRRRQAPSNEPTLPDEPPYIQAVNPGPSVQPPIPPPKSPSVSDEWEKWDSKTWEAAALKSTPEQVDLAQIAEDASILLELFSKTKPRINVDIGDEHKEMIENAFQSIMKIRKEFRLIAAQKNESIDNLAPPERGEGAAVAVDSECIICYTNIADMVVLPCKHLVLCITCCDKMGIKEKAEMMNPNIHCPICRTKVEDRLKIFRG